MDEVHRTYLPAAGRDWALALYDPIVSLLGIGPTRRRLIEQAAIQPGQRVLEIGCGTGSLSLLIKQLYPGADVTGLDPDPKALARARAKRGADTIHFDRGFSDALPYPDASFDRVFSSFMFHHLKPAEREPTLREVRRALKPGGSLHLVDFAGHEHESGGALTRLFHSHQQLRDNVADRVLGLMSQAGLSSPELAAGEKALLGLMHINYYRASLA